MMSCVSKKPIVKVNPLAISIPKNTKFDLNDPIQARMSENVLSIKKSNLWRRRNKVSPDSKAK